MRGSLRAPGGLAAALLAWFAGGLVAMLLAAPARADYVETPELAIAVAAGQLPPVAERLPAEPLVVDLAGRGREAGVHGGVMTMFIGRAKDVRYMAAWGYTRLVGYDEHYEIVPDLLRAVDVEEGRRFTLHLRAGHRWSDGHPFTAEDFRYWWEDIANNADLAPGGLPAELLVDGAGPVVSFPDAVTVVYEWAAPNPRFLPALAQARPLYIFTPAHYMRRYHARYAVAADLDAMVAAAEARGWAQLHNRMDALYDFDNPELPVLDPWVNTSPKNGTRFVLRRNPYYHRVDAAGRQLPYVDTVEMEIAAAGLIAAKATMGEAGLQARSLTFADAPVLRRSEEAGGYRTLLWRSGAASEIALYPNLCHEDPVWRALFQDVRFRRALSLGISRRAINNALFFGFAEERGVAALEESPFYDAAQAQAWAHFDLDAANALLDEIGLTARDGAGTRLLPDGRPLEIVVETAGERTVEDDALQLVRITWGELGIRLIVKQLDRDNLRNRAYAGKSMMVAWFGWNNGIPTPDAPPVELAPVDQANFSWPRWGQFYQTQGAAGAPPSTPEAIRLLDLFDAWGRATAEDEKAAIWREMLAIHADQVFVIGTVARAPIPIVVDAGLANVPPEALYAWDPGAQLGVHRMDEFFFRPGAAQ